MMYIGESSREVTLFITLELIRYRNRIANVAQNVPRLHEYVYRRITQHKYTETLNKNCILCLIHFQQMSTFGEESKMFSMS